MGVDEGIEIVQRKDVEEKDVENIQDLLALTERPPVVRLVNVILADAIKLKKKLQEISPDKIKNVNHAMTKGIATFRIKAKMTAEELAEHLVGGEFASIIEIVDLKTNRIQAKKVGG